MIGIILFERFDLENSQQVHCSVSRFLLFKQLLTSIECIKSNKVNNRTKVTPSVLLNVNCRFSCDVATFQNLKLPFPLRF